MFISVVCALASAMALGVINFAETAEGDVATVEGFVIPAKTEEKHAHYSFRRQD